jgi:hypothetical protein
LYWNTLNMFIPKGERPNFTSHTIQEVKL